MSNLGKDFDDAELAWPSSGEESTPFNGKPTPVDSRYSVLWKAILILIVASYVMLGTFYVKLKVHSTNLEAQVRDLQPKMFPSLASSAAFRKKDHVFPLTVAGTPFAGAPSQELDHAWHELLEGTVIRVSGEDLEYYNVTSLPLADGSGFASEIFMTHELHCLKKIRQWVYKESYFEDIQGLARNELERHVNHCIETLRQGIMCRGDVSLGTYTYLSGGGNDVTARSWATHQCVDFDALMVWTKARSIDIFADGVLIKAENVSQEHITERTKPHE